jgi:hypothetical protein
MFLLHMICIYCGTIKPERQGYSCYATLCAYGPNIAGCEKGRGLNVEIKSILIKDTTKEERIQIVQQGLNQCGGACDFCNGCDNLGGGSVDSFYEPYINGEKELRQLNEEYRKDAGLVR